MTQPQDLLQQAIAQALVSLDPASGLPFSPQELAAKLRELTDGHDKARAHKKEAEQIAKAVEVATKLKERASAMDDATARITQEAVQTYQRNFGEDEAPAAAPAATATPPAPPAGGTP